ncbi:MAG TPA: NUDIX hydrolase [Segetibacter sp.]|jgi:8-oxo-dGTP pyrophosphatase MutT (NUDIX family)
MEDRLEILALIEMYKDIYAEESERVQPIVDFLNKFDGAQLFDRKNFVGHVTASAYITNPQKDSLLLLRHKFLNRWLQPGGHIDASDTSLVNAALREAEEETGIAAADLQLVSTNIFRVDSHTIPANEKKNEPQHVHHDISFLFLCNTTQINIDEAESTTGQWALFSELEHDSDYREIIKKINLLN